MRGSEAWDKAGGVCYTERHVVADVTVGATRGLIMYGMIGLDNEHDGRTTPAGHCFAPGLRPPLVDAEMLPAEA